MKTVLPYLVLLGLLAVILPSSAQTQTWKKSHVNTGSSTGDRYSPTIVVDTNLKIHIGYAQGVPFSTSYAGAGSGELKYVAGDTSGATWSTPIVYANGGVHHSTALVYDSTGKLNFFYSRRNTALGDSLNLRKYTIGTGFGPVNRVGPISGSASPAYPAAEIDPKGRFSVMIGGGRFWSTDVSSVWSEIVGPPSSQSGRGTSVAVSAQQVTHIVYATTGTGPAATRVYDIYYMRDSGAAFSVPITLQTNLIQTDGAQSSTIFGLGISTDPEGNPHVVFTKALSRAPSATSALYYMYKKGNQWTQPVAISDTALYARISFMVDQNGALHVAAEKKSTTASEWDIVYLTNLDGEWSSATDVTNNSSDDLMLSRMLEVRDSLVALVYMTKEYGSGGTYELGLATSFFRPPSRLIATPDTIDFGNVFTGDCRNVAIKLYNRNRIRTQTIQVPMPTRVGKDSLQFVQTSPSSSTTITTNDSANGNIRFCPKDSSGCYSVIFRYTADNGTHDSILVKGCAIGPKLRVKPDTVDFGIVPNGDCKDTTIMIYNLGGDSLIMRAPVVEAMTSKIPFRADSVTGSKRLPRLDSTAVRIWYCPTDTGLYTAQVIYTTMNRGSGNDTVVVMGRGQGPRISVNPDTIDFGRIPLGTCKDSTFNIANIGGDSLRAPGPAIIGTDLKQFRMATPNDSVKLRRRSNMDRRFSFCPVDTGCFTARIIINSNAGSEVVYLKGCAFPPTARIQPDTLDFGLVRVDSCKDSSVVLRNSGQGWLLVTNKPSVPNGLGWFVPRSPTDTFRVAPGGQQDLRLAFCPKDTGCMQATYQIQTVIGLRTLVVKGCGGAANIELDPAELNFGGVPVDSCKQMTYTIRNRGVFPLEVTDQTLSDSRFKIVSPKPVAVTIPPGGSQVVTVEYCPTDETQAVTEIWINSNAPGASPRVTLRGRGERSRLTLPSRIDFGDIPQTSCRDTMVVARNPGTSPITLTVATLRNTFGDRGFSIVAPSVPRTVAGGDTVHLRVRFCPKDLNLARDTAVLGAGSTNVGVVSLLGRGISGSLATSTLLLDFNDVDRGSCKRDSFSVRNIGTVAIDLTADNIEAMTGGSLSGAFKLIAPKPDPSRIDPGKSISIVIEFCPGVDGRDSAVWHGTGTASSEARVDLRGSGVTKGVTVSTDTIQFDCVLPGGIVSKAITVTNTGTTTITIDSLSTTAPFAAPLVQGAPLPAGGSRTDSIRFEPTGAPGNRVGELTITTSGGTRRVVLIGEVSAEPVLLVDVVGLEFGNISVGDTGKRCIIVSNPACADVTVSNISIDNNSIFSADKQNATPFTIAGKSSDTICVEFFPAASGDVFSRIHLLDGRGQSTSVNLHGVAVQPSVVARPRELNFGSIDVGKPSDVKKIAVTNLGMQGATVTPTWTVTGDNAHFVITAPTLPADLMPDHGDTIWFDVQYIPQAPGPHAAELTIDNTSPSKPVVQLIGSGEQAGLAMSPLVIDMGNADINITKTATDTLVLTNTGTRPVRVVTLSTSGPDATSFSILGFSPITIPVGGNSSYSITFSPTQPRAYTAWAVAVLDSGARDSVTLLGRGTQRVLREHVIWIDTVTADVGVRTQVKVHVEPPLEASEAVTGYTVTLKVDPMALYPYKATTLGAAKRAASPTLTYTADGRIVIDQAAGGEPISGSELFALEFEGLFTGKPTNSIVVDDVTFTSATGTVSSREGLVNLNGCDVGKDVAFGRRVMVNMIRPNPITHEAIVLYTAPPGSSPRLSFIDVTGREVLSTSLPSGTGMEQEARVIVSDVSTGIYLLELRDAGERTAVPVIISR